MYVAKNGKYIRFADDYETNDIFIYNEGKLEIINENFTTNTKKAPTLVAGMNLPQNFKNLLKNFSLYYIIKYIKKQKKQVKENSYVIIHYGI